MAAPTGTDLARLLDVEVDVPWLERAGAVISIVEAMAKAHTRGNGWTDSGPVEEIRSVILTASARLLSNSSGLLRDEAAGPESVSYRSAFTGWTAVERICLDRHRVKAL